MENERERADAGRDGRTRLARPNSQARTATGEYSFSLSSRQREGLAAVDTNFAAVQLLEYLT